MAHWAWCEQRKHTTAPSHVHLLRTSLRIWHVPSFVTFFGQDPMYWCSTPLILTVPFFFFFLRNVRGIKFFISRGLNLRVTYFLISVIFFLIILFFSNKWLIHKFYTIFLVKYLISLTFILFFFNYRRVFSSCLGLLFFFQKS
jgi:hypothetical protein